MNPGLHSDNQPAVDSQDRRRRNRLQGEAEGWVLPASPRLARHSPADDEAWEVRIHDVSRLGVGFTTTSPMNPGEEHRLRIGRGPMRRARIIRIVACHQCDDATFIIGAQFTDLSTRTLAKAG